MLVEPSWSEVLSSELGRPYIGKLFKFVMAEAAGGLPIYPPAAKIFNAFNTCPLKKVKVVILGQVRFFINGFCLATILACRKRIVMNLCYAMCFNVLLIYDCQDPYPGPGQAMGLCFSVEKGVKFPPSLLNIFKEIQDDVGCTIPSHGNLEKWSYQVIFCKGVSDSCPSLKC